MLNAVQNFFKPPQFEGDEEKTRIAGLLARALLFAWILPPLLLLSSALLHAPVTFWVPLTIGITVLIVVLNVALRRGLVTAASIGFIATFFVAVMIVNYDGAGQLRPVVILYPWLIITAGLFLGSRGTISTAFLLGLQAVLFAWLGSAGRIQPIVVPATPLSGSIVILVGVFLAAVTFNLAAGSIQTAVRRIRASEKILAKNNQELQDLTQSLELRVQERTLDLSRSNDTSRQRAYELQIVAEVARAVTSVKTLAEVLPDITKLISDRFGYYHVGIFLLDDEREYAELRAASSDGGQRMLARDHRLRVDATSIVGYVSSSARPRIASDVGSDVIYFKNPDLPETHSEMALPLIIGEKLIGVLDIQSTEASAFDEQQIEVLGTLANQVAIAIENANLFGQTRQALAEAQRVYDQFIAGSWTSFARSRPNMGYRSEKGRTTALSAAPESSNGSAAERRGAGFGKCQVARGCAAACVQRTPDRGSHIPDQRFNQYAERLADRRGRAWPLSSRLGCNHSI